MRGARLSKVLAAGLLVTVLLTAPALAGYPLGWKKGHRHRPPPGYVSSPLQMVTPPPSPYYHGPSHPSPPAWNGYGFGVPTFQWGYFGARYRPVCITHKGYYGNYTQWSYRSGY